MEGYSLPTINFFPSKDGNWLNTPVVSFIPPLDLLPLLCFGEVESEAIGQVQFSHSDVSNSLQPHGLHHTRLLCPSPTLKPCSNSCALSWWCHQAISSSVIPFPCLQTFPASGSFPMSQFFTSGGQSIRVSASASDLLMNIQDWFPSGLTGLTSLQSKGLSRVFSREPINTGHTSQLRWEEPRVKRYKVVPGDKLSLSRTLTKLIIHLPCHCLRFL